MNPLFENKTKYTTKVYDTFLEFHREKYHFSYVTYNVVIIGFLLFCLILQVHSHHFTLAIMVCCALSGFVLWRCLHPVSEIAKEYQSDKFQQEQIFTFQFFSSFFTCKCENEITKVPYYQLYRVFETEDFFYLYLDRNHAFLVYKFSFQEDDFTKFSNFIHKKCPLRYRNSTKKVPS